MVTLGLVKRKKSSSSIEGNIRILDDERDICVTRVTELFFEEV